MDRSEMETNRQPIMPLGIKIVSIKTVHLWKRWARGGQNTPANMAESDQEIKGLPVPPAQVLYKIQREGVQDFQPQPVNGAKQWKSLARVTSAPLDTWIIHVGVVAVHLDQGPEEYAKVSDLRRLEDGRFVVVYTWLYTRQDIESELQIDGALSENFHQHLDQRWPTQSAYKYMLSTNCTITLWDTAIRRAPNHVTDKICQTSIYSTTPSARKIWSANNPSFKWMKQIFALEASNVGSNPGL
ncbi:hypothetical protein M432DRAFT_617428 [Thermoascus aurantiacus ATCC 26904]